MHSTTDRRILHVNPKLCEILGYTREELLGMTTADFLPAEYRESDRPKYLEPMLRGELQSYSSERPFIRKDGTIVWTHRTISLVRDSAGQPRFFLRIIEDISERKQTSERLARLAHYDSITRLPNRVLFHDRLGQSIAQARRNNRFVGVLFLDLDRFKLVNDTLGHAAGDQLLKKVAERLTQALRPSDTVGRLSGDEFAVILPELTVPQHAGFVAQKLIDMLKAPFDLDGNEVFVTASIGITLYPFDSDNIEMLIRDADAAMYSAKAAGRNTYQFYTTEMNQRATEKLRLETGLRRAIEREEFVLHYQPKVEVVSGKITGLEALLRWQAPDGSVMGPDQFIPLLEETGLIVPVGNWVVRSACAQLHAWHEAGVTPVPVAVNLSARQLRQPGFSATLGDALAEFDVPAKLVEIEITESSLMENPEQAIVALTEIESLGIRLSADDFGTGYSSLSYLKRLPLDALKIDRSFVRDITIDPDDAAITRTVITLAHGLGLRVIAEGVETEEQFAFLRENHCDEAQGYLFSQPLPADACTGLLASGNTLRQGTPEAADQQPAVLVVDDDRDHLLLTRLLLQQDGHHVIDTTSTRDAFELLATRRVDIIVSDQSMPGMDGVEFLRRVKLMYPHAMRIMLSGAGDFDAATAAINEGEVHKFFIKGRDEELLRREIGKKFRQGGAFPAEHQAAP
jgi:diguanylate cyclase (GGDEF)-like protein/PAS domain S-box-containing protein